MNELFLKTRSQWRRWLEKNHATSAGVWLLFYRKGAGDQTLEYEEAVEEALCFGWVDSLIKKLDEERYARKMTPRTGRSRWSASNMKRVEKLLLQGLMTAPGLRKVEEAKKAGLWKPIEPPPLPLEVPSELNDALDRNARAKKNFDALPPSQRKYFVGWVALAKRPDTRQRRVAESIRLLEQGKKLGLK